MYSRRKWERGGHLYLGQRLDPRRYGLLWTITFSFDHPPGTNNKIKNHGFLVFIHLREDNSGALPPPPASVQPEKFLCGADEFRPEGSGGRYLLRGKTLLLCPGFRRENRFGPERRRTTRGRTSRSLTSSLSR